MDNNKKAKVIHGSTMAYVESGQGDPIVFIHGNPSSSYIWRNITPHVDSLGRCIAPDLIGMGDSDKLEPSGPDRYTFVEHRDYLDALLEALGVDQNVTLVGQDWGSALAFDWANRNREKVKGIVHTEAILRPWTPGWMPGAEFPIEGNLESFLALRTPLGEQLILEQNVFVEGTVVEGTMRKLGAEEFAEYRRPFAEPGEGRRPTLTWPRQIPYQGQPADVEQIISSYAQWLPNSDVPKLFINAEPGFIIDENTREWCRTWKNQTEVTVRGKHFVQEDSPSEIGSAIADWYRSLN
ncbi:haloalkane dehalogenase [Pseudarthrobacter sulfonivorans]|uniref:haloalkane dehalogenase n=1 Tax=Pseudarthrobacter sulfonivorans TaxID=121292 RepID=UPI00168B0C3C|nr:haloalkane dehalogenase [Pseudarthrobacter sulfonivorans]